MKDKIKKIKNLRIRKTHFQFSEYLSEKIDKSISFSDYLSNNYLDTRIGYSEYLSEKLTLKFGESN
jgi:hypothetical protein